MSIDAVDRAITFTEDNLHEQVTVGAMAEAAHYSLYHFCRVFGRYSGLSPHTYLIRRRLTLAVEHVVDSRRRIVQIAHEFGFDSHEGFPRAFGRLFAVTPMEARDRGWVTSPPRLPTLTHGHLTCLERHGGLVPVITEEGEVPDSGGGVVHIPVPLTWPDARSSSGTGEQGAGRSTPRSGWPGRTRRTTPW